MSAGENRNIKVVCFSEIQWKYVRTRKQQILSRFPEDWEILFLSTFVRGKRNNIIPERDGRVVHACVPIFKNFPKEWQRKLFSLRTVRFLWNVLIYIWVKLLFLVTGFNTRDRVFIVSNVYYGAILRHLKRRLTLYDCNDDHLGFPNTPDWAELYLMAVIEESDIVVAVSEELVDKLKLMGVDRIFHIGNGVDYELFQRSSEMPEPEDVADIPHPRICYSGAIAPWFDFELMEKLADVYPRYSFVLLGPVFEDIKDMFDSLVGEKRNIHYLGSRPYESLGTYLSSMDVCIIPLKMNELMRYADPNKVYEYAAVGKPIVTLEHTKKRSELKELIYTARNHDEFIAMVKEAVEGEHDPEGLKEYAKSCSWQARADAMKELIIDALRHSSDR